MGLIKAAVLAIGSGLADQWFESLGADGMGEGTVFTGAKVARPGKSPNMKSSADCVSNGSRIVVQKNRLMMLVDGGKIVDYTAEEGYYTANNSSAPSLFNGQFGEPFDDAFNHIKFGGVPSGKQQAFFINLQEIKGNRFGTLTPMNYFDILYNAELFLRAYGHYSIRIMNSLQFYVEVIPRDATYLQFSEAVGQYLAEPLQVFQVSVSKPSAEGEHISFIQSKIKDRPNAEVDVELDKKWGLHGFELVETGVDGPSYDDQSQEPINMRNQGAMFSDVTIREGFAQGQITQGIHPMGEDPNGDAVDMMGVSMGMNVGMGFMGQANNTNYQQMQMQQQAQQQTQARAQAQATVQAQQMQAVSQVVAGGRKCPSCDADNTGKFCTECGARCPESSAWKCPSCGAENSDKFRTECGNPRPQGLRQIMAGSISHKCPDCGGELVYTPEKGGLHCPYYSSDFTEEKIKALYEQQEETEAAKGQVTEEKAAAHDELIQYSCPNCDAVTVTEESTAAIFCYYCHNPVVLVGHLSGVEQPQYVLPFAIDQKKALDISGAWIKKKKFVLRAFYDEKQIEKFTRVYFPYLLYSCEAHSNPEGVGTRVEHHERGDIEEIVTSEYQINRYGDLPVKMVARNTLKEANRVLAESVQPLAAENLKPFASSCLSGFVAERRNMESDVTQTETREEVSHYVLASLRSPVSIYQGPPVDAGNVSLDHEKLEYVLMLVWTMAYRELDSSKFYYFSLNGQSGKVVGELPVDNGKLLRYFPAIFVPLFIALLALIYFIS